MLFVLDKMGIGGKLLYFLLFWFAFLLCADSVYRSKWAIICYSRTPQESSERSRAGLVSKEIGKSIRGAPSNFLANLDLSLFWPD